MIFTLAALSLLLAAITALLFRVKDTLEQRYGSEATLELMH